MVSIFYINEAVVSVLSVAGKTYKTPLAVADPCFVDAQQIFFSNLGTRVLVRNTLERMELFFI